MCVPARGNFFLKEEVDTNFSKGRGGKENCGGDDFSFQWGG